MTRRQALLLADHRPDARAALADLLRRMGLQVDSADSVDEAVQATLLAEQRGRPHELLLIDADMPGTQGLEALRRLRARLGDAGMPPCILIVDDDQAQADAPELAAGTVVCLGKPVTWPALSACIDQLDRQPWPRQLPDRGEALRHARVTRLQATGRRVLLAEDSPTIQDVTSELLRTVGMSVDLAGDGQQAVALAARHDYDLVLMDMRMPVMDGLAATRALRAMPRHARTPILAMTADAGWDDHRACQDAGMDDHIAKPVDPELLYARLGRWLPARARGGAALAGAGDLAVDAAAAPVAPVHPAPVVAAPPPPAAPTPSMPPTPAPAVASAPAATALAPPAAIDFSGIPGLTMSRALLYLPGRGQIYARVLRQFSDHYGQGVPGLDAALQAGDWAGAQRLLHSLRGACGAVGAIDLQAEAQVLETRLQGLASPGAVVIAPPDAAALHAGLAALVAALRGRLGSGDGSTVAPAGPSPAAGGQYR
jgi:two-component system sensor histidine kinase/response regulator